MFTALSPCGWTGNTDSRQDVRKDYPEDPVTGDALEAQQLALLQAQEDKLQALKKQPSKYKLTPCKHKTQGCLSCTLYVHLSSCIIYWFVVSMR